MMNTVILLLVITGCIIFGYLLNGRKIVTPVIIFLFPFLIAILDGLFYYSSWEYNLSINTVFVISVSSIIFTATCSIIHNFYRNKSVIDNDDGITDLEEKKGYPSSFYIVLVITEILVAFKVLRAEKAVVSRYQPVGSLVDVITGYNNLSKFSDFDVNLSFLDSLLQQMLLGICLFVAYSFAREVMNNTEKTNGYSFVAFFSSVALAFLTGNRIWPLAVIFSFVITSLMIAQKQNRFGSLGSIHAKYLLYSIVVFVILVALFYLTTITLQRNNTMDPVYYISVYLGAPLKNFDIAMTNGISPSAVPGEYSFNFLFLTFIYKFGLNADIITSLPYQSIGTYELGNVYTLYFVLISDFGVVGCFFIILLLAIAVQLLYETAYANILKGDISFAGIVIGYVMFQLMMSFFAHFVTQNLISLSFVKTLLSLMILFMVGSRLKGKSD